MVFYNTPAFTKYINENKEFVGHICRLIKLYCDEKIECQHNHYSFQIMHTVESLERIVKQAIDDAITNLKDGDELQFWSIFDSLYEHMNRFTNYTNDPFILECNHQMLTYLDRLCNYINERLIENGIK